VLAKLRQSDYTLRWMRPRVSWTRRGSPSPKAKIPSRVRAPCATKAQLDWERAGNLYGKQSLTKPDYDAARAQLDGYQAQLDANEAQVKLAQARLAGAEALVREADLAVQDSTLKAPLDAMVLKRMVEIGVLVARVRRPSCWET